MVHIRRRDVPQSLVIALVVVVPYEALYSRYKLFQAVVDKDVDLSPNPPKDTDGRREESGRGVRELQGK